MPESTEPPITAADTRLDYRHRMIGWTVLCFCSIISLAAHLSDVWDEEWKKDDKYVIILTATSAGLAFLSIMGYAIGRDRYAGGAIEGSFAVVCQLSWVCLMPVIMDPDRDIAVSTETTATTTGTTTTTFTRIRNANMYFFSWASTIAVVYVLGRFSRQVMLQRQNDPEPIARRIAPKTNLWYLLTLSSLVVLVDSVRLRGAFACPGEDPDLCLGIKLAISLGTIGTFFSFGSSLLATIGRLGLWLEFFCATLIFGLYMAGVALITFNDGPGTSLGNLYFATWMGCSLTVVLLSRSYLDLVKYYRRRRQGVGEKPHGGKPQEAPVVFPDIEMGAEKKEIELTENDNEPSWAKEEKTAAKKKEDTKKDDRFDDEDEPGWAKEEDSNKKKGEKNPEKEVDAESESEPSWVQSSASVPRSKNSKVAHAEEEIEVVAKPTPKRPSAKSENKVLKKAESDKSERDDTETSDKQGELKAMEVPKPRRQSSSNQVAQKKRASAKGTADKTPAAGGAKGGKQVTPKGNGDSVKGNAVKQENGKASSNDEGETDKTEAEKSETELRDEGAQEKGKKDVKMAMAKKETSGGVNKKKGTTTNMKKKAPAKISNSETGVSTGKSENEEKKVQADNPSSEESELQNDGGGTDDSEAKEDKSEEKEESES